MPAVAEPPATQMAISGVTPAETKEALVMTVWPSVAMYWLGREMGKCFAIRWPDIYIFRLGNLFALLSIPIALKLYFFRVLPFVGTRYTLTNRRVIVYRGIVGAEEKSVDLDRFDSIDIVVQPGQAWYHAGDLVFKRGNVETFRLGGVSRPEAFRSTIMKARQAYAGVRQARQKQRR